MPSRVWKEIIVCELADAERAVDGAEDTYGTRFVGRPGREAVEAPNLDACEWYSKNRSAAGAPAASPAVAPLPHL